jgi:hypothetical protein
VEAIVIGDQPRAQLARATQRWLEAGWTIERMHLSEARDALVKCRHAGRRVQQRDLFVVDRS